ncbi:MAG: hypothetical protein ABWZ40_12445 [Caulobacterales bacterium]
MTVNASSGFQIAVAKMPRKPIDGFVAFGVPWDSDDMVSFERAVRERWFEVISGDVETLLGRKPRSLRDVLAQRFSSSLEKIETGHE